MARRAGRGRLSSLETLPEHAEAEVSVALEELADRKATQEDILARLNARLAALDPPVGPISRSAFSRFTVKFSSQARRLAEAREAAAALAERLEDMPEGDVGLMLGETIKALLNDVLMDRVMERKEIAIGDLRAAAEAIERLEKARRSSHDVAVRAQSVVAKKTVEALDGAVAEGRLNAEAARKAREIMGFA